MAKIAMAMVRLIDHLVEAEVAEVARRTGGHPAVDLTGNRREGLSSPSSILAPVLAPCLDSKLMTWKQLSGTHEEFELVVRN
jgi:hypothetical protein